MRRPMGKDLCIYLRWAQAGRVQKFMLLFSQTCLLRGRALARCITLLSVRQIRTLCWSGSIEFAHFAFHPVAKWNAIISVHFIFANLMGSYSKLQRMGRALQSMSLWKVLVSASRSRLFSNPDVSRLKRD